MKFGLIRYLCLIECLTITSFIVTIRDNSCGKVMFSQVSVHRGCTPPALQTATAADGTHPTGMHSCVKIISTGLYVYIPWFTLTKGSIIRNTAC